jgi:hypothetical protein
MIGNPAHDGLDNAEIFVVLPFMQAMNDFFRGCTGQGGDAIVSLHAAEGGVVSGAANGIDRKFVVLDLGFLQAHHIGFVMRDPVEDDRQATADRIYVVGGDFHREGTLGSLDYPACSRRLRSTVADMQETVEADPSRVCKE